MPAVQVLDLLGHHFGGHRQAVLAWARASRRDLLLRGVRPCWAPTVSKNWYPDELALPLAFPNRRFRLWTYLPTHSGLVVRSEFEPGTPHVELLFQLVRQINLPTWMNGLMVAVGEDSETSGVTFTMTGDDFSGHVIASYLCLGVEERSNYSPFSIFHGLLSSEFPPEPHPPA